MRPTQLESAVAEQYALAPPLRVFALPGAGSNNKTIGVASGAGAFVLKRYQTGASADSLRREHRLLAWLAAQDLSFAVPEPLATRSGDTLFTLAGAPHALFRLLPGEPPDPRDLPQLEAVGAALGELHIALERYAGGEGGLPRYADLERIHPLVPRPEDIPPHEVGADAGAAELLEWWRAELGALRGWLAAHYDALPRQHVHGDFAPINTLIAAGRVAAVLDFEMATADARAIDVAAGLKFSMRLWEGGDPLARAASFLRGYRRRVALTPAEAAALPWLMRLRDAVSCVWWLGRARAAGAPLDLDRLRAAREQARWLELNGGGFSRLLEGGN